MQRKIITTLSFVFCINVVPLLFKPELLLNYKSILLLVFALAIFLTQPAFSIEETISNKSTDRFSIILILLTGAFCVISSIVEWAYFNTSHTSSFFTTFGIIMCIIGLIFRIWSILVLDKFFTATARSISQHILIKSGPYSLIRHPSYTGAIMAIEGVPILLDNTVTVFSTIILLAIAYHIRIKYEEKVLVSKFGKGYTQYAAEVKKIIPFIW